MAWVTVIEYVELSPTLIEAANWLEGLRLQNGFLAGRCYATKGKDLQPFKMQAFFRDDASLSDEEIAAQDNHHCRIIRAQTLRSLPAQPLRGVAVNLSAWV